MIMALLALVPMSLLTRFLWLNKSKASSNNQCKAKEIDPAYFRGLGHLIENEPDKAIDAFSHLLEVDQDTIDLHLFLGCLFRSRGEVSRAIRIHENILARPQLSQNDDAKVRYELARDYLQAGFFNYAETHFKSLIKGKSDYVKSSLQALVNIYEQEKDWRNAIDAGKRLCKVFSVDIAKSLAHYYCEHVLSLSKSKPKERIKILQQALKVDPDCARANLMLADEYISMQQVDLAFAAIEAMKLQSITFIREVVSRMWQLHALGLSTQLMEKFWRECLELTHDSQIIIALAQLIRQDHGDHMAIEFLSMMMRSSPSIPVMLLLVEIYIEHSEGNAKEKLRLLRGFMLESQRRDLPYLCQNCGFSGALMYWQCPGCRSWETVQPKDQMPLDHFMEY